MAIEPGRIGYASVEGAVDIKFSAYRAIVQCRLEM